LRVIEEDRVVWVRVVADERIAVEPSPVSASNASSKGGGKAEFCASTPRNEAKKGLFKKHIAKNVFSKRVEIGGKKGREKVCFG